MGNITIKKVETKSEMKKFIRFNYELYKDNQYSVPDIYEDMLETFSDKNAAMEFCEAIYFLAYKDGKVVGRVAGIINNKANKTWNLNAVRFGWIDFIDDPEVSRALIEAVEEWGRSKGKTEIQGPLGFTDLDAEGMLIEGFEELSTMATIYNYPYYPKHMERLGYVKDVDWVEFLLKMPKTKWEKAERISALVERKYGLRVARFKSRSELAKRYGHQLFELVNECYAPLYGYTPLTDRQIGQHIKTYLPVIDLRLIALIVDKDDNLVGMGVSIYSLADALRKSKGKMLPFGWWHLLKALFIKPSKRLDFLLVAVKPEYQSKGAFAMIFNDLVTNYIDLGIYDIESNPELETNHKVQSQWNEFERIQHKRRRAFKKELV
jgi:GNAT superfamily N-acetyltransferase